MCGRSGDRKLTARRGTRRGRRCQHRPVGRRAGASRGRVGASRAAGASPLRLRTGAGAGAVVRLLCCHPRRRPCLRHCDADGPVRAGGDGHRRGGRCCHHRAGGGGRTNLPDLQSHCVDGPAVHGDAALLSPFRNGWEAGGLGHRKHMPAVIQLLPALPQRRGCRVPRRRRRRRRTSHGDRWTGPGAERARRGRNRRPGCRSSTFHHASGGKA